MGDLALRDTDISSPLLAWYDRGHRDLPWRRTHDPYAIWVSEIMCQQTRVDTVIPYYHAWLDAFPTVQALANASQEDVYARWQGLGYYSRARNLQRGAQFLMATYDGALPREVKQLRDIPGVGPYTAGAIASIAFGLPAAAVDGNVIRVLTRLCNIDDDIRLGATTRALWNIAQSIVPNERTGDFNQAMMELGATVCTPKNPRCDQCPVMSYCSGRHNADGLPFKSKKTRVRHETRFAFALTRPDGQLLVARTPPGTLLGGMWQYPMTVADSSEDAAHALFGPHVHVGASAEPIVHIFSHIRMTVMPVNARIEHARGTSVAGYTDAVWMSPDAFVAAAQATLTRKVAKAFAAKR